MIPASAKAYVNHRIHPTDDIASVINHDRAVIGDFTHKFRGLSLGLSKIYKDVCDCSSSLQMTIE